MAYSALPGSGAKLRAPVLASLITEVRSTWATWTPTTANLTLGSGTITSRYRVSEDKTGDFFFSFLLGAGSAVGTLPSFTLPFTPHSSYVTFTTLGNGELIDAGTNTYFAIGRWTAGSAVEFVYLGASGVHTAVTATAPYTFTSGDRITCIGKSVEIA